MSQQNSKHMDIIYDSHSKRMYEKGDLLGQGTFAKCYELKDIQTEKIYAAKIVPRIRLVNVNSRSKMTEEITIHRSLKHKHIVGFHSCFEDSCNMFVVLELCPNKSLMGMLQERITITKPEARYFMQHLLLGVKYLHDQKIIHRDLKLANLLISDDMELKIGDFGLATRVENGEKKMFMCGTPHFVAPEVLANGGYSFEVDIWSMGVILYALLVGKPPFPARSIEEILQCVKTQEYLFPTKKYPLAAKLFQKLFRLNPSQRPTLDEVSADDFMLEGYTPLRLPTSCLTTAPDLLTHSMQPRIETYGAGYMPYDTFSCAPLL